MIFLALLGSLALFLYGMKIMSEGLQKFAGDRLRSILTVMTTNRVTGGADRYVDYRLDSVFFCYNRDGGQLCKRRLADAFPIYRGDYGSEHRNYGDGVDYLGSRF